MCRECHKLYSGGIEQREEWLTVVDHGEWSTFHKTNERGNSYMAGWHHSQYLTLLHKYNKRWK